MGLLARVLACICCFALVCQAQSMIEEELQNCTAKLREQKKLESTIRQESDALKAKHESEIANITRQISEKQKQLEEQRKDVEDLQARADLIKMSSEKIALELQKKQMKIKNHKTERMNLETELQTANEHKSDLEFSNANLKNLLVERNKQRDREIQTLNDLEKSKMELDQQLSKENEYYNQRGILLIALQKEVTKAENYRMLLDGENKGNDQKILKVEASNGELQVALTDAKTACIQKLLPDGGAVDGMDGVLDVTSICSLHKLEGLPDCYTELNATKLQAELNNLKAESDTNTIRQLKCGFRMAEINAKTCDAELENCEALLNEKQQIVRLEDNPGDDPLEEAIRLQRVVSSASKISDLKESLKVMTSALRELKPTVDNEVGSGLLSRLRSISYSVFALQATNYMCRQVTCDHNHYCDLKTFGEIYTSDWSQAFNELVMEIVNYVGAGQYQLYVYRDPYEYWDYLRQQPDESEEVDLNHKNSSLLEWTAGRKEILFDSLFNENDFQFFGGADMFWLIETPDGHARITLSPQEYLSISTITQLIKKPDDEIKKEIKNYVTCKCKAGIPASMCKNPQNVI